MNILLTLAYDGTNYVGWQRQQNGLSVQQTLEDVLTLLFAQKITVTGASRTDAGVHALGQRAAFRIDGLKIPIEKLPYVINSKLPADIAVRTAEAVPADFNPRFCARQKTYRYQIYNAAFPNPLLRRYSAFVPQTLDFDRMQKAAPFFTGRHDFRAFCASGGSAKTTVREIFNCCVTRDADTPHLITLTITGNGFLYNMVRIIAGTVLYVGLGKREAADIPAIIASGDRVRAGVTLPPEGLTLVEVQY